MDRFMNKRRFWYLFFSLSILVSSLVQITTILPKAEPSTSTASIALPVSVAEANDLSRYYDVSNAPEWVVEINNRKAEQYGANAYRMLATVNCETGGTYNPRAKSRTNDYGLAQFHVHGDGSSLVDRTPYAGGDLYDAEVSLGAMAFLWGTYGRELAMHWSCWRALFG